MPKIRLSIAGGEAMNCLKSSTASEAWERSARPRRKQITAKPAQLRAEAGLRRDFTG
jgi:hypothetical protein